MRGHSCAQGGDGELNYNKGRTGAGTAAFWAQAALFVVVIPWVMVRLSPHIDAAWNRSLLDAASVGAGALVSALGAYVAIRGWLYLWLMGASPMGIAPRVLVTRGIYQFVLDPVYWGYTMFWAGTAIRLRNYAMLVMSVCLGAGFLLWAVAVERPALRRRYGVDYAEYHRQVPSILPTWKALFYDWRDLPVFSLIIATLVKLISRALWAVDVKGIENAPRRGPGVIVCNHVMYLDPFLIGTFSMTPTRYVASDELFRKPITRWFFSALGAIPKKRWSRDIGVLRKMHDVLKRGELVEIFPEGQRNWDGAPVPVGDETYRLLMHLGAPVTCVCLHGGHEAWPRWSRMPARSKMVVEFFPRLNPSDYSDVAEFRRDIEERIFAFVHDEPQPRLGFPVGRAPHRGIATVMWGCIKCGAPQSMGCTDTGMKCRACGASFTVTPGLELVDDATGFMMLERDYRAALIEMLAGGRMQDAPGGEFNVSCSADAYMIKSTTELMPVGSGKLTLGGGLVFTGFANGGESNPSGGSSNAGSSASLPVEISYRIEDIDFTYLNLANHLVVVSRAGAYQFHIKDDSPVRWEDYLLIARGSTVRQWRSGEQVRRRAREGGSGLA